MTRRASARRSRSVVGPPALVEGAAHASDDVDHAVGDGSRHVRVVAGDDQRHPLGLAGQQQVGEQAALVGVEALLGFVEEQHPGGAEQDHGEVEELLLPRGQLVGEPLGQVVDLEGCQQLVGALIGGVDGAAPGGVDEDEVVDQREVAVCRGRTDERGHPRAGGRVAFVERLVVEAGAARRMARGCRRGCAAGWSCRCRSRHAGRRTRPERTVRLGRRAGGRCRRSPCRRPAWPVAGCAPGYCAGLAATWFADGLSAPSRTSASLVAQGAQSAPAGRAPRSGPRAAGAPCQEARLGFPT